MSSRQKKWPTSCLRFMSLYIDPICEPIAAPERTLENPSTIIASAYPLWPAMVSTVPSSAFAGSSVGVPSGASAQPSGILSPDFCAAMMFPRAMIEVARSIFHREPFSRRKRGSDRVRAEERIVSAFRAHRGLAIGHRQQNHVLRGRLVAVVTQRAEMLAVAHGGAGDAGVAGHRIEQVERFGRLYLSQPIRRINRQSRSAPPIDHQLGTRRDHARANPAGCKSPIATRHACPFQTNPPAPAHRPGSRCLGAVTPAANERSSASCFRISQ